MKKLILASAIILMASGGAFAQSSQGQAGAQAGVNGNAPNAPDSTMNADGMRQGTVGMDRNMDRAGPNGSPTSMPRAEDSPTGKPSEGQSAPK